MEIKKGIGVSSGVAVCQALVFSADELRIGRRTIPASEIESERHRLSEAIASSKNDIGLLRDQTARDLGQETAAIFNFHLGLLDDPDASRHLLPGIEKNRFTAEYAVSRSLREYSKTFLKQKDAYFRERVKDIYDIERRLISKLQGDERITPRRPDRARRIGRPRPHALADRLARPLQGAGHLIDAGGRTSHTAIIANSMGIPAVVGLENITQEVNSGDSSSSTATPAS